MTINKTSTAKWILPPELKLHFDKFVTLYDTIFKNPEKRRRPLLIHGDPGVGNYAKQLVM